jgi:hypothetical protein
MPKHAQSSNRKKILLLALGLLDPGPPNLKDYDSVDSLTYAAYKDKDPH